MDYRKLFPKEYLASHDLNDQDVALTIRAVVVEEITTEDGKENKGVVYFAETKAAAEKNGSKEKRLILNVTNAKAIAAMHGNETDGWKGKAITVFPTTCQAFGKTVDCIRVRPQVPQAVK